MKAAKIQRIPQLHQASHTAKAKTGLNFLTQAIKLRRENKPFEQIRDALRQAYQSCLRSRRKDRVGSESATCQPVIATIKKILGETYYAHYIDEARRIQNQAEEIAAARQNKPPLEKAKLLLREIELAISAREQYLLSNLLTALRPRLNDDNLFALLILYYFAKEEKVSIPGETIKLFNGIAEKIIEEAIVNGLITREAINKIREYFNVPMTIAINLLLLIEEQQIVYPSKLIRNPNKTIRSIAEQRTKRAYAKETGDLLAVLAEEKSIPLSQSQTSLLGNNDLLELALGHLIAAIEKDGQFDNNFWDDFFLSSSLGLPEDLFAVCRRYNVPPVMISSRITNDPPALEKKLAELQERKLLWLTQQGIGKEWLDNEFPQFLTVITAVGDRVQKMTRVFVAFGIRPEDHQQLIITMLKKYNLTDTSTNGYLIIAQIFEAAKLEEDKRNEARQAFLGNISTGGSVEDLCCQLLTSAKQNLELIIQSFGGLKREAMRQNRRAIRKVARLALISEEDLTTYSIEPLERVDLVVNGQTYLPFSSLETRLCVCVSNSIPSMLEKAEKLIKSYGFTQEVFDNNPAILDGSLKLENITPVFAALAFVKAARQLIKKGYLVEAMKHARAAKALVDNLPQNEKIIAVIAFTKALQLLLTAKEKRKNNSPVKEVESTLREACAACLVNREKISSMREPILEQAKIALAQIIREQYASASRQYALALKKCPHEAGGVSIMQKNELLVLLEQKIFSQLIEQLEERGATPTLLVDFMLRHVDSEAGIVFRVEQLEALDQLGAEIIEEFIDEELLTQKDAKSPSLKDARPILIAANLIAALNNTNEIAVSYLGFSVRRNARLLAEKILTKDLDKITIRPAIEEFLALFKKGEFKAATEKAAILASKHRSHRPLLIFAKHMKEGKAALAQAGFENAFARFNQANKQISSETEQYFVSEDSDIMPELEKVSTLWLNISRACLLLAEYSLSDAFNIFLSLANNNAFAFLNPILSGCSMESVSAHGKNRALLKLARKTLLDKLTI